MWKEKLANGRYKKLSDGTGLHCSFSIGEKVLKISEMRSKHFHTAQVGQETPIAVTRWEEYGYKIEDWKEVFRVPYRCTQATNASISHLT